METLVPGNNEAVNLHAAVTRLTRSAAHAYIFPGTVEGQLYLKGSSFSCPISLDELDSRRSVCTSSWFSGIWMLNRSSLLRVDTSSMEARVGSWSSTLVSGSSYASP